MYVGIIRFRLMQSRCPRTPGFPKAHSFDFLAAGEGTSRMVECLLHTGHWFAGLRRAAHRWHRTRCRHSSDMVSTGRSPHETQTRGGSVSGFSNGLRFLLLSLLASMNRTGLIGIIFNRLCRGTLLQTFCVSSSSPTMR